MSRRSIPKVFTTATLLLSVLALTSNTVGAAPQGSRFMWSGDGRTLHTH
jgi:hypothetical protein